MQVGVVGAGSWGTTVADLLAGNGHAVRIWAREPEVVASINTQHLNHLFLPDSPLAEGVAAAATIADVVRGADLVVSAAPSHAVRVVGAEMGSALGRERPVVVSISKGLERETHARMSEILAQTVPGARAIVALSGPSFAREVHQQQPTAVVAASTDHEAARAVQSTFANRYFRVYTSADVVGVELGGALKNVIAIAAGIADGLGLGHNPRAALITRGLAEIARLGAALGADPMTFLGLAGMGDLVLTATGGLSRNRTLGMALGQGRRLADILAERHSVAEGVETARQAVELGATHGVDLPIAHEVAQILFEGKAARQAIQDLMLRELKPEHYQ